jgi:hypothetical protein
MTDRLSSKIGLRQQESMFAPCTPPVSGRAGGLMATARIGLISVE